MDRLSLAVIAVLFSTYGAVAQQVTVDLKKVDPQLAAQILEAQRKDTPTPTSYATQAKEWAGVGTAVGDAIGATARSLSVEVNEFVKTPVGKWAFFFLFWYIIGHKVWSVLAGIVIWIVLGSLIWRSFTIFHRPKQVVIDEGGRKRVEVVTYRFVSDDARSTSAFFHALAFAVLSVVMIVIVL